MTRTWKLDKGEVEEALKKYIALFDPSVGDPDIAVGKPIDVRIDMQAYDNYGQLDVEVVQEL